MGLLPYPAAPLQPTPRTPHHLPEIRPPQEKSAQPGAKTVWVAQQEPPLCHGCPFLRAGERGCVELLDAPEGRCGSVTPAVSGTPAPEAQRTLKGEMRVTWRSSATGGALWCKGTSWARRGPPLPAVSFSVMGQSLVLWIWRLGFDLALCPRASVSPDNGLQVPSYFYPLISQDETSAEPGAQSSIARADEQFSPCRTRYNPKA